MNHFNLQFLLLHQFLLYIHSNHAATNNSWTPITSNHMYTKPYMPLLLLLLCEGGSFFRLIASMALPLGWFGDAELLLNGLICKSFVGLTADLLVRFERIQSRLYQRDQVDFETFARQDDYEASGASSGQSVDACLTLCDQIIDNSFGLMALNQALESAIQWSIIDYLLMADTRYMAPSKRQAPKMPLYRF